MSELDRVQLSERQQELPSAFPELADLRAKLFGYLNDALADIVFTRDAQIVFVPHLDHERRNHRQNHEQEEPSGQADANAAPADKPTAAFLFQPVRCSIRQSRRHHLTP